MSITAEKIAAVFDDWSKPSKLQLHAGEMTAGELRTVRAILPAVKAAVVSLLQQGEPEGWKLVDSAPEDKMLVTYRAGEQEISAACVIRENHRGEPQEIWAARDGRDTITHGSYAAPTHWLCECPPLPPAPGAETGERESIAPAREVNLKPGWLARDIESASRRIDEWEGRSSSRQAVLEESGPELLARLGTDAGKWAAEFRKVAISLGYSDMDEGWLIGWFANAMMNEHDKLIRSTTPPAEGETK